MKRSNIVKLIVDEETKKRLLGLLEVYRACWNTVNWLRMQQFKNHERVGFGETEKETYEKFKRILKVNAQQVTRKNAEAWRSFFALIKEKRQNKNLKPRPPGYWKQGIILVRNDRYTIDEEKREIYLKDFKMRLKYAGKLKWKGKQGRLEIHYDEVRGRFYAFIPMSVEDVKPKESGLKASIDLGIVNLVTMFIENGKWFLFKGGSILSQYEYYSKKIAITQKKLALHGQRRSRRLSMLYRKRSLFMRHVVNSMVRRIMNILSKEGVIEVRVGYPKEITKNHGNKLTVNFWNYRLIIRRLKEVGEELGIKVIEVNEAYTSKTCTLCGETHPNGRIHRGLFKCPRMGKVINADLNAAVNILRMHISPSPSEAGVGGYSRGGIGVIGLKTQPVVYRWTNGAGWRSSSTSNEAMRMKAVNHKPMNHPKGNPTL
ncbi:RNA-guided endonuclease InsQ/TnpB family protein [Caldivirga maquilingensis]|uniref:Transposase, IS605 OrfB family n=1 Tax=Caldivirga maquilingensis (strain ATCC 700844 / DSM 13496 / JCM 10307 / IC-167) TaxID=397948 RepID=A8MBQ7_CALMQ|nr:RNA-guided endonuclease TnpB family protein [Caldivirga maquilingensis]ABW01250.1 transposase, IS605 OrfB family [Caldivirga maquilingensis IC-167]